jgi:malate dehydrogenase (oxaloacetate-decarboxylating)
MCFAAAKAMSDHVGERLAPDFILPDMDDWEVFPREAAAVAMKAAEQGLARIETTYEQEFQLASRIIKRSRDMTKRMMEEGFIPEPPEDDGDSPEVDVETIKAAY